jgi:hypothetical protein
MLKYRVLRWGFVIIVCAALTVSVADAQRVSQQEPCVGELECYENPPETGGSSGSTWSGYSDGRLNPDPAEYYSIWCNFDLIEVWGGVPNPQLLITIPILDIFTLEEGGVLDLGNGMTVVRNTADTITIYGSNGNLAPAAGSKAFSLSECIARNGGVPESSENVSPLPEDESEAVSVCANQDYFFENMEACLYEAGFNDAGVLLIQWMFFCTSGGTLPIAGVFIAGWHWRRRRTK